MAWQRNKRYNDAAIWRGIADAAAGREQAGRQQMLTAAEKHFGALLDGIDEKKTYSGTLRYNSKDHTFDPVHGVYARTAHYVYEEQLSLHAQLLAKIAALASHTGYLFEYWDAKRVFAKSADLAVEFMESQKGGGGSPAFNKLETRQVMAAVMSLAPLKDEKGNIIKLQNIDDAMAELAEWMMNNGYGDRGLIERTTVETRKMAETLCDAELELLGGAFPIWKYRELEKEMVSVDPSLKEGTSLEEHTRLLALFKLQGGYKTAAARKEREHMWETNREIIEKFIADQQKQTTFPKPR
jgi:hypothetical protein